MSNQQSLPIPEFCGNQHYIKFYILPVLEQISKINISAREHYLAGHKIDFNSYWRLSKMMVEFLIDQLLYYDFVDDKQREKYFGNRYLLAGVLYSIYNHTNLGFNRKVEELYRPARLGGQELSHSMGHITINIPEVHKTLKTDFTELGVLLHQHFGFPTAWSPNFLKFTKRSKYLVYYTTFFRKETFFVSKTLLDNVQNYIDTGRIELANRIIPKYTPEDLRRIEVLKTINFKMDKICLAIYEMLHYIKNTHKKEFKGYELFYFAAKDYENKKIPLIELDYFKSLTEVSIAHFIPSWQKNVVVKSDYVTEFYGNKHLALDNGLHSVPFLKSVNPQYNTI